MAIAGRISLGLGVLCLVLAGFMLLATWNDNNSGAWFAGMFDSLIYTASAVLAVLGAVGLLYGISIQKRDRQQHRFEEAMKDQYKTRDE